MKKYQNTLLAGVAALALVAGTGLASAQQSGNPHGASQTENSHAAPGSGNPHAGQSTNGKGTETQALGKGNSSQTQAQEKGKSNETQAQQNGKTNTDRSAQSGKENANPSGQMGRRGAQNEQQNRGSKNNRQAERQNSMKGLRGDTTKPMQGENQHGSTSNNKGNTSNEAQQQERGNNMQRGTEARGGTEGGNVQLSEQQRTQIKTTVINGSHAPRVGHVDFDVRVGTAIPRGKIHAVPVPETLVRIEPRWRGFLYFVYEDEVVIVNPRDMHIVAVVSA